MGYLESKIGKAVKFGPPRDAHRKGANTRNGKIVDEVWAIEAQRDAHPFQEPSALKPHSGLRERN